MKNKNRQIAVSFSHEDFAKLSTMADTQNITKAQLIRNHINVDFDKKREPKIKRLHKVTDPALLYELNKLGNNLNQIAKHLNSGENKLDFQMLSALISIEAKMKALL